ncbi:MAG: hypothetical protein AAF846_21390 [Chloroflexota bacterium]
MVRELIKKRVKGAISLQKDGTLSLAQPIMERLGYNDGDTIVIAITETGPLCIGLRIAKPHENDRDYTLGYLYKNQELETIGGRITCSELSDEIKANLVLPQRSLRHGFPPNWKYDVLILPGEINWQVLQFNEQFTDQLPNHIGVYKLVDADEDVLYIGEGNLRQRFRNHLQNKEMALEIVAIRYCKIDPRSSKLKPEKSITNTTYKDDAVFLQK